MTQDKIQRVKLYAQHAKKLGQTLTIRQIASDARVTQWELFQLIEEDDDLTYWAVTVDGVPIRRQGLYRVEYIGQTEEVVA
jgi:hypothetical protein